MGVFAGPDVSESGLVLALDAASPKNYNLTEVEVLVVAGGGGGGGGDVGAGGGAGGLIYNRNFAVTPGSALTVTVGGGGAGSSNSSVDGTNGSNSVFGSLTAIGGGGGASWGSGSGQNGGSGGGSVSSNAVGQGTAGQGNNGGNGLAGPDYPQGGGGGAGGVGQTATIQTRAGDGGVGLEFPQFASVGGSPAGWFAGGGGGGVEANTSGNSCIPGTGGLGGGGNGGRQAGTPIVATSGATNTGGGGGGNDPGAGGNGGSGIVIVRYPGPQKAIGGTVTSVAGHTIHTFTGSSTFTPLSASNGNTILGLSDFSNNNNFGTTANSPTYSSANGGSVSFDGTNDYISMPFETILNDCSIEIWFKATSTRSYQYLLSIGNEVNSSYSFYLDMNDPDGSGFAQTMWVYWNSGGTPYSVIPKTGTYGDWNDSTWRHYVFTRSSTTNHYMNGSLVTNVSRSGDQTTQFGNGSGYKLKIGVYQITNTNAFPGNVASVKIYNRALTAAEISQNFNANRARFGI